MAPRKRTRGEVEALARQTLVDHGLFVVPVNPVVVAKRLGARVVNAVFAEPRYAGLTARRGEGVTILVKESDPPLRKRFTVAHEVGHLLLHLGDGPGEIIDSEADFFRGELIDTQVWTETRQREYEANVFAAELLMPRDIVRAYWVELPAADRTIAMLAAVFQVSEAAMGLRVEQLGLSDG